mmetsp:Transcript_4544/g.16846  ORF Transcript_4544/g.16846 Transcript_4544/m.16846 type:complete len:246 (-) Transcript_4544:77-814(-)
MRPSKAGHQSIESTTPSCAFQAFTSFPGTFFFAALCSFEPTSAVLTIRKLLPRPNTTAPSPPNTAARGDHAHAYTAASPTASVACKCPLRLHVFTTPSSPDVNKNPPQFVHRVLVTAPRCASRVLSTRPLHRTNLTTPSLPPVANVSDDDDWSFPDVGDHAMAVTKDSRSHTFPPDSPCTSHRAICLSSPQLNSSFREFHPTAATKSEWTLLPPTRFTSSRMSRSVCPTPSGVGLVRRSHALVPH